MCVWVDIALLVLLCLCLCLCEFLFRCGWVEVTGGIEGRRRGGVAKGWCVCVSVAGGGMEEGGGGSCCWGKEEEGKEEGEEGGAVVHPSSLHKARGRG